MIDLRLRVKSRSQRHVLSFNPRHKSATSPRTHHKPESTSPGQLAFGQCHIFRRNVFSYTRGSPSSLWGVSYERSTTSKVDSVSYVDRRRRYVYGPGVGDSVTWIRFDREWSRTVPILKACTNPLCRQALQPGQNRCVCGYYRPGTRPKTKARPNASRRGYDHEWRKLRTQVLSEEPNCRTCGAPAIIVDHIIPIRSGGARLDRANCQSQCRPCHGRKTNQSDGGFGNPRGGVSRRRQRPVPKGVL